MTERLDGDKVLVLATAFGARRNCSADIRHGFVGLEERQSGQGFDGRPTTAESPGMERAERMRILSVVDEESAAMVMMLERKARVDSAPGFASAREFPSSDSNVLVTLDYQFPDRNGQGDTESGGEESCRFLTPLLIN